MSTNRLQPENLTDFTGGLNLRRDQFTLADNESPDMLNVDVDPRGGFYTRKGWQRWVEGEIVDIGDTGTWHPVNAAAHNLANGDQQIFVVETNKVYVAPTSGVFTVLAGVVAEAEPHGADFAPWGDDEYIACGMPNPSVRYESNGTVVVLDGDTWSEVDTPILNTMPQAEYCEPHAGYLFTACTFETGVSYFARIRWSHPNHPDAWRELDYLDIDAGGGRITAIMSFLDHLLIFKTNSLWALYGYDEDSWQLVKVSQSVGCPSITGVTRSETAAFFFSSSNGGGVYAYNGSQPVYLSEKLRTAFEAIETYQRVWVSWANRRLWVSVPWRMNGGAMTQPTTLFVYDSDIGDGAWTQYRSDYGAVTIVITGSDVNAKFPLAAFWSANTATMLVLDRIDDAYDSILQEASLAVLPDGVLVTHLDEEILVTGGVNLQPFESYYRTRWLHGGWPDRRKSWRRPTFICRRVPHQVDLLVQQYRDYDETTIRRTGLVPGVVVDNNIWSAGGAADPGGLDWGEGGTWGAQSQGASITRAGPMGHAAAIQMKVQPADYTPLRKWGVDGIVVKLTVQRFRT